MSDDIMMAHPDVHSTLDSSDSGVFDESHLKLVGLVFALVFGVLGSMSSIVLCILAMPKDVAEDAPCFLLRAVIITND